MAALRKELAARGRRHLSQHIATGESTPSKRDGKEEERGAGGCVATVAAVAAAAESRSAAALRAEAAFAVESVLSGMGKLGGGWCVCSRGGRV